MSEYNNQLAAKDDTIKVLKQALMIMSVFIMALLIAVIVMPKRITVHIPPDLSGAVTTGITDIPDPSVYTFAFYIFQQLNRWPVNGGEDYEQRIHNLKNYMTPACFQNRLDDLDKKRRERELNERERAIWEIAGRGYGQHRVIKESDSSWLVSMVVELRVTLLGELVKDRLVNYPVRFVRYRVDYELNPFQLALDCFSGIPRVIEVKPGDKQQPHSQAGG
jgi:integrating conjugative element protein (TIGR03746 family)